MKRCTLLSILFLTVCASLQAQTAYQSQVWSPDNGDGTYRNPVLYADYSDPDACAVDDDFYLTASSFNCVPGLPILHSRDLVNWQIIGHALQQLEPADSFALPQHGKGVWAPAIRHHKGQFYIYWGDPDRGIFMVRASDPAGRWEEPVCVVPGRGLIDPCPLWDDDGRCYLVNAWANSRAGFNSVLTVRELSADGTRTIGLPRIVFDGGQQNHTAEGPKMYKRDGWYWIMCPAGGVAMGWQLAMRSRSPYGPYEWKRVMWQGKTAINGPHQGAWVHVQQGQETGGGEDWFLHFNDQGALGRVVMLQPVDWSSGWPIMGDKGQPYTTYRKPKSSAANGQWGMVNPQESDDFTDGMGLQWQWHANYDQTFGMPTADGCMRLYTRPLTGSLWQAPNLLLQKLPAPRFVATARVRMASKADGQWGGLVMMGRDYSALVIRREGDHFVLQRRTALGADEGKADTPSHIIHLTPSASDTTRYAPAIYLDLYLQATVTDGTCSFAYSQDGRTYIPAGPNFTMKPGKWIGAKIGFVAESDRNDVNRGWLDVDWIRFTPLPGSQPKFDVDRQLSYCHRQVERALTALQPYNFAQEPRNILQGQTTWNCRPAVAEEWCSGFWPGVLWMDYGSIRGQEQGARKVDADSLRRIAEGYTESLSFLAERPAYDHDLGFLVINSFLKGYEQTKNEDYKRIALAAADTLGTLFNPTVGTILSWPRHVKDYGGHNTIMDNMINLDLLFWAAANGGNPALKRMAVTHAETTMRNHFRPDGSCYHVAVYDTLSGRFLRGQTHQGYADYSMWSRGQSWAIYGYTMVYRWTKDKRFLDFAQKVTDIYLKRLRETSDDWVPLWDMDDPRGLSAPKDASAACVVASALLELSDYVKHSKRNKAKEYQEAAVNMLTDLSSSRYQSGDRNVSFLMHSTGHHPAGSEIDASIIYADYYYIEALLRLKAQTRK